MSRPFRMLLALSLKGNTSAELDLALPMARILATELRLLHVVPDPVAIYSEFAGTDLDEVDRAVMDAVVDARGHLEALSARAREAGVATDVEVRRGDVRACLVEAANDYDAAIVAIHPGEHGAAEQVVLGTTSRHLLHHLDVPVLLLRRPPYALPDPQEIVVPVDPLGPRYQPDSDTVGALALGLPGRIHFVSVLSESDLLRGRAREFCHAAARSRLEGLLQRLSGFAPRVGTMPLGEVVYASKASEGILRYVWATSASLVCLRTHGHRSTARAILGSVCDAVATRAPCSVLAFPGQGEH